MTLRSRIVAGATAVSMAGIGFIAGVEGTKYQSYPDAAHGWSVPTICTGHTGSDVYRGQVASKAMCDDWLAQDSLVAVQGVLRCTEGYRLRQHELDALASFAFNVGVPAYCSSTMSELLRAGDRDGAIRQFDRWVYAKKKDCRIRSNNCYGVYTRRMAEKRLFATGDYGHYE